jgi:hypothetical protein
MRDSSSQITTFIGQTGLPAIAVRKGIPHNHVDLPHLVSIEATEICVPKGNCEVLLAAVYKPPGKPWSAAGVINLLNLRNKSLLADDLNAVNSVWNSQVSNPSGEKLLTLLINNDFQISALQSPIHYTPRGNGDVLDIVIHQNVRLSDVNVSDVLDSDHLPIFFHILDRVNTRDISAPVETHTDWERFRSLATDLIQS